MEHEQGVHNEPKQAEHANYEYNYQCHNEQSGCSLSNNSPAGFNNKTTHLKSLIKQKTRSNSISKSVCNKNCVLNSNIKTNKNNQNINQTLASLVPNTNSIMNKLENQYIPSCPLLNYQKCISPLSTSSEQPLAEHFTKSEPIYIKNPLIMNQLSSDSSSYDSSPSTSMTVSAAPAYLESSSAPAQNSFKKKLISSFLSMSRSASSSSSSPASHLMPSDANNEEYLNSSSIYYEYENSDENDKIDNAYQQQSSNKLNGSNGRGNRFFPDNVVDILNQWFYENQDYPYPDENMTNVLAKDANISAKQVRKWFANKRVRSNKCYKQTFRNKTNNVKSRRQTKSMSCEIDMSLYSCNNIKHEMAEKEQAKQSSDNEYEFDSSELYIQEGHDNDQELEQDETNEHSMEDQAENENDSEFNDFKRNDSFPKNITCNTMKNYSYQNIKNASPVSSSSLSSSVSSSTSFTSSNCSPISSSYSGSYLASSPATTHHQIQYQYQQILHRQQISQQQQQQHQQLPLNCSNNQSVQDILYDYGNFLKSEQNAHLTEMNNQLRNASFFRNPNNPMQQFISNQSNSTNQNQVSSLVSALTALYSPYLLANLLQSNRMAQMQNEATNVNPNPSKFINENMNTKNTYDQLNKSAQPVKKSKINFGVISDLIN